MKLDDGCSTRLRVLCHSAFVFCGFLLLGCSSMDSRWRAVPAYDLKAIEEFKKREGASPEFASVAPQVEEALDRVAWLPIEKDQDVDRARDFLWGARTQKYKGIAQEFLRYIDDANEWARSSWAAMVTLPQVNRISQINQFLAVPRSERMKAELEPERQALMRRAPWEQLNKNSCRSIYEFHAKLEPVADAKEGELEAMKAEVSKEFYTCIERKLLVYVGERFPAQKDFLRSPIYFTDGTETNVPFLALFRIYLGRNPTSGARMEDAFMRLQTITAEKFSLTFAVPGAQTVALDFQVFGGKVNCVGFRAGLYANPEGWPLLAFALIKDWSNYPIQGYWDFDWIDKQ